MEESKLFDKSTCIYNIINYLVYFHISCCFSCLDCFNTWKNNYFSGKQNTSIAYFKTFIIQFDEMCS